MLNNLNETENRTGFFSLERIIGMLVASVLLWLVSRSNYLLFHVTVEGFSIVVACLIYVLASKTWRFSRNNFLLYLGNAYIAVALIDFFHTLAYKGMGVFPGEGANAATQLWIAARYLEAFALFSVPWLADRFPKRLQAPAFLATAAFLVAVIMNTPCFPDCYVTGKGLTTFKVASEYVICGFIAAGMYRIWKIRNRLSPLVFRAMMLSMGTTILSEMTFTLYTDVYGVMNGLGHILKVISFMFIFQGVVMKGLEEPYGELFHKLKESTLKDPLTGLCNRLGFMEVARRYFAMARRDSSSVGMLMMDLDHFKNVNDRFGHLEGDRLLVKFADLMRECVREADVPCRFGGDEFVVLMQEGTRSTLLLKHRILARFEEKMREDMKRYDISLSIGTAAVEPEASRFDLDSLIQEADEAMYREKNKKRAGSD